MAHRLRPLSCLALALALSVCAVPDSLRAQDAPDGPGVAPHPAPPRPETAGWVERLLSDDPATRAAAEASLADASPPALRALVAALRARLRRAASAPGEGDGDATPQAPRPARGVRTALRLLDVAWADAQPVLGEVAAEHGVRPAAEASEIVARLERAAGLQVVAAPTVVAYDGQPASVEVRDRRSFVADIEVREVRGVVVADPKVRTVETGLRVEARARVLHDGGTVNLDLEADARAVAEPVAREGLPVPAGFPPVAVQRPEVLGWRWARGFAVPRGFALLAVLPEGFGAAQGRRRLFLVTTEVVPLDPGLPGEAAPR